MRSIFERIIPFIFLGIMIVLIVAGFILLSYVLIFGAAIGLVLYFIAWIRDKFFKKSKNQYPEKLKKSGRTIDHDDLL